MEKIKVKNNSTGGAGYFLSNSSIRRSWLPHQTLLISTEELEEGFYEPGIKTLFTSGLLYIENIEDRKKVGLVIEAEDEEIDELEGTYSREEILKVLQETGAAPLGAMLNKAKNSMYDLIVALAVENEITDSIKVKLIREKTGVDVLESIQNLKKFEDK